MVLKRWRKLYNDQRGFSFTELLATLIVVSLATTIVAAGIPVAQRAYIKMVDSSNSQVFLSTVATRLRDELGFAQFVSVHDNAVDYVNGKTGRTYHITQEEGTKRLLRSEQGATGVGVDASLFSEKASTDLTLKFESVSLSSSKEYIEFTDLQVTKEGYESPLATLAEYDIRLSANKDNIS